MKYIISLVVLLLLTSPDCWAMRKKNPAGRISRLEGSVVIVREGKEQPALANVQIFQSDEIKTGPDSLVEFTFLDGSNLHQGPDSKLVLSRFLLGLVEDNPRFICRILKGVFVYISGTISKFQPGAVKFETPDGTVAVRGTKLLIRVMEHGSKQRDSEKTIVVLLKDPNGVVGQVTVSNRFGQKLIVKEKHSITVYRDTPPPAQVFMNRNTMEQLVPVLLHPPVFEDYTPGLPYTEPVKSLFELDPIVPEPIFNNPTTYR
ncbi:MAG: hypothetical protein GY737_20965 [Desulfobacteraceae bacterium]|nr:hypothetical protein [Desulfobacteraceae bacterium]